MSLSSLFGHRTVRAYTKDSIPQDVIDNLVKAGVRGSNTGNMQLYSIILTTDPDIKARLAPAHFNQPMVTQAPLVVTICADINRFTHWCRLRNADAGFDNFETFLTATIDATIVAQNIALAAEEEGLGLCYLGTTTYNPKQIAQVLNLPHGVVPITTLTIGYPDPDKCQPNLTDRLPNRAVVHNQTYADFSDEDIDNIYAAAESDETNKRFVAENSKENLAQVFAEVRYPRANNEAFSQKVAKWIKEQGF